MKVNKVINNNIVSAYDKNGQELIVMGRGIGFQMKEQQDIPSTKIEKIFRMENEKILRQFKDLIEDLPLEYLRVSMEIISYAKTVLDKQLNPNIYLTLSDHINFAIERHRQNILVPNPLFREVKNFYPEEYQIGVYAVALLEKRLEIQLQTDEASSIALHVINAEYDMNMHDIIHIMDLVQKMLEIILAYFSIELEENSLSYERFITHLKFLAQRIFSGKPLETGDWEYVKMIAVMYPEAYACSLAIQSYIKEVCGSDITGEEVAYLAVYIRRIVKR